MDARSFGYFIIFVGAFSCVSVPNIWAVPTTNRVFATQLNTHSCHLKCKLRNKIILYLVCLAVWFEFTSSSLSVLQWSANIYIRKANDKKNALVHHKNKRLFFVQFNIPNPIDPNSILKLKSEDTYLGIHTTFTFMSSFNYFFAAFNFISKSFCLLDRVCVCVCLFCVLFCVWTVVFVCVNKSLATEI